jgi:ATP-dependent DNA helicase RecG
MRQQLAEGFQIYAVTPLISESETIDLENAEALHDRLAGEFPDQEVVLLHGKMTAADKEQIMDRFAAGEVDILVTTSVIEVGVDVANANLMVIFDADRFGLSQLHQLRGRIGRGQTQSYCVFLADPKTEAGKQEFRTGSVVSDYQVMVVARDEAKRIVQADPDLKAEKLADLQAVIKYKKIVQARA